jgi:hypothetical protein
MIVLNLLKKRLQALLMKFSITLFLLFFIESIAARDDAYLDFTDQMTPVCSVVGLTVEPPTGWINVPIDSQDNTIAGCQMMLIESEALIGIMRLLSVQVPDDIDAHKMLVGIEAQAIVGMNYELGERLWHSENVPVSGLEGFGDGNALGVSLSIPGNANAQEGHFLTFHGPEAHYILTLLTPAESVDDGSHYEKLTRAMSTVMTTLKQRTR